MAVFLNVDLRSTPRTVTSIISLSCELNIHWKLGNVTSSTTPRYRCVAMTQQKRFACIWKYRSHRQTAARDPNPFLGLYWPCRVAKRALKYSSRSICSSFFSMLKGLEIASPPLSVSSQPFPPHGAEETASWRRRCKALGLGDGGNGVGPGSDYRMCSNRGPDLYLTPAHGLYWKEVNIRDRPLFRLEENRLLVEWIKHFFVSTKLP